MQNHEIKDALKNLRQAFTDLKDKFEILIDVLQEQETRTEDSAQTLRIDVDEHANS